MTRPRKPRRASRRRRRRRPWRRASTRSTSCRCSRPAPAWPPPSAAGSSPATTGARCQTRCSTKAPRAAAPPCGAPPSSPSSPSSRRRRGRGAAPAGCRTSGGTWSSTPHRARTRRPSTARPCTRGGRGLPSSSPTRPACGRTRPSSSAADPPRARPSASSAPRSSCAHCPPRARRTAARRRWGGRRGRLGPRGVPRGRPGSAGRRMCLSGMRRVSGSRGRGTPTPAGRRPLSTPRSGPRAAPRVPPGVPRGPRWGTWSSLGQV
mmetsp:Transcript_31407/g.61305  ORF Transcript_31407/g.61305 Transcript_31407/m.61305 type:complete len:264 (+) Transcript_31407:366-1157(+)